MGPHDLLALRHDRARLQVTRAHLARRNAALAARVDRLTNDDSYIEHRIRRELGYARPDELVYKFAGAAPRD